MPGGRRFRNLRIQQVLRGFERLGYVVERTRGSHYMLRHPDKGLLVLPFHRGAVKAGVVLDALKKAGVSADEFEEVL